MAFAICPDEGYPRIWRYVESNLMPSIDTVATLDRAQNVLTINRELFDALDVLDKVRVLRTHAAQLNVKPTREYVAIMWPHSER